MRKLLKSYGIVTVGSVILAFAFDAFYAPNQMAMGGITGMAQVVNALIPSVTVGVATFLLNVPLFLAGWKMIGFHLLASSLFSMVVSSLAMDAIALLWTFPAIDPILAAVYGGALTGLGVGIVFTQGATTGGADIAARLMKLKLTWLPMGKLRMGVDLAGIVLVALFFRNLNTALYGLVALYISTLAMDGILYGLDNAKVAYIISDHNDEISSAIVQDLDRGVTILHGQGAYTGAEKQVLMCAFKQREIAAIKAAVKDIDPDAFLIVCNAHEVLGDGFREYKKDGL